jgi:hypothetical protein
MFNARGLKAQKFHEIRLNTFFLFLSMLVCLEVYLGGSVLAIGTVEWAYDVVPILLCQNVTCRKIEDK